MKTRHLVAGFLILSLLVATVVYWPRTAQAQVGFCDRNIAISVAAAATQTVVSAVNGATVRVCAIVLTADTLATTVELKSGTTTLTNAMRLCDECSIPMGDGSAIIMEAPTNGNFTITAATGAVTGFVRLGQN